MLNSSTYLNPTQSCHTYFDGTNWLLRDSHLML